MDGALRSCPSRIFFAGACIMSGSYELSGRLPMDESGTLDPLTDTEDGATGDERDEAVAEVDVDASGGVAPPPLVVLFARALAAGSFT